MIALLNRFPLYIQAHISPAVSPKFSVNSANNYGRQSILKTQK